jgi:hypothetical protein
VRAGLVGKAESWARSSAAAHCATLPADEYLAMEPWQTRWSPCSWRAYLFAGENESELSAIRQYTRAGRPLEDKGEDKGTDGQCVGDRLGGK